MSRIEEHQVRCPCGCEFKTRLHTSVNTQLSPDAVEEFLEGKLNRPACPSCGRPVWVLIPVLFNDMEREFMVWAGSDAATDPYVEEFDQRSTVIHAGDYLAALAALVSFRADPENAALPFKQMNPDKVRAYVDAYLRVYERFRSIAPTGIET